MRVRGCAGAVGVATRPERPPANPADSIHVRCEGHMSLPFSSKSPALSNYDEDIKPLVTFLVAFTPPSPQMVGSVPPASDRASVWMAGSILPARSSRRRRSAQNSVCWAEKLRPMCAKARGHKTKTTQMTRTKTTDPVKRPTTGNGHARRRAGNAGQQHGRRRHTGRPLELASRPCRA